MADDNFWKGPREFGMTRWSMVRRARSEQPGEREAALNDLCEAYWYPIYAFIRRKGQDAETAKDLAQDFLSHWIAGSALDRADQDKGKFRTFLLSALSDFLVDEQRRRNAKKRGGLHSHVSLDGLELEARYKLEPLSSDSPESAYDRHFAEALLERARTNLHEENTRSARPALYHELERYVTGDMGDGEAEALGEKFGMMRGAVSAVLFRMRKRFRQIVKDEVLQTLQDETSLDEEMRHLFATLLNE